MNTERFNKHIKKNLFLYKYKEGTEFNWHGQKKKAGERESINNVD